MAVDEVGLGQGSSDALGNPDSTGREMLVGLVTADGASVECEVPGADDLGWLDDDGRSLTRLMLGGGTFEISVDGGCQAGGNGISHVSPDGYLEPCPAARLAADSLAEVSLAEALSNP